MVTATEARELIEAVERFLEASQPAIKERLLKPIERKLEKAMVYAFALQRNAFLERFVQLKSLFESMVLREAILEPDWMRLFTQAELETLRWFVGPIDEAVMASLLAGGQELMASLGIAGSFNLTNPRAVTYLTNYGANLVKGVNETTKDYLRTVVTEGTSKGWSYNKTAKTITDRYQEFRIGQPQKHIDSRAHLIAVTESGNAYERGNMIVAEDLRDAGLEMEKSWLVTGGDICDLCLGNEAGGWIPIDLPFNSGVMQPLAHPACRCACLYQRKGAGAGEAPPLVTDEATPEEREKAIKDWEGWAPTDAEMDKMSDRDETRCWDSIDIVHEAMADIEAGQRAVYYKSGDFIHGIASFEVKENTMVINHLASAPWNGGFSMSPYKVKGVGSKLIEWVFEVGVAENVKKVELDSLLGAVEFYKKVGFEVIKAGRGEGATSLMRIGRSAMDSFLEKVSAMKRE